MHEDFRVDLVRVQERIGTLSGAIEKAHTRIDGLNIEVKKDLDMISKDVKELLANMNQTKGARAAWVLVGSLGIALLAALVKIFVH